MKLRRWCCERCAALGVSQGQMTARGHRMKAVQFSEYGGPDVLQIVEAEEPHAGPGQVRIAVRASGVNGLDWKVRAGLVRDFMPVTLPSGSGLDAAGVVDEVGDGVTDVVVGDTVFGSGSATLAQYAVLTDWTAKPAALSFEEAAGYPVPVETAVRILDQVGASSRGRPCWSAVRLAAWALLWCSSPGSVGSPLSAPPVRPIRNTFARWARLLRPTAPGWSTGSAPWRRTVLTLRSTWPVPGWYRN